MSNTMSNTMSNAMSDDYARSLASVLSPLGQVLVPLSTSNTQNLLSEASRSIYSRRGEAIAILARLKELNPIVADQFRLKDDVFSELSLRMISEPPWPASRELSSFIIISYCWHSPDWPLARAAKPIAPGWEISRPMVDAAMGWRDSPEEGIWLDKLCINQNSARDKQVHIGVMDVIYRSARRVLILLEDVQLSEEEEAAGLTYAGFYADMCRKVRDENLEGSALAAFAESYFPDHENMSQDKEKLVAAIKLFVMRISSARWFSRAWCAHESSVVTHGKKNNPLVLCYGHEGRVVSFEFRCINYIATYLKNLTQPLVTPTEIIYTEFEQRCGLIQQRLPTTNSNQLSMNHIGNIIMSGCLEKEDLISIALNTSSAPLIFTGYLAGLDDILWVFSLLVLATNDPTPLTIDDNKLKYIDNRTQKERISWASFKTDNFYRSTLPISLVESITGVTRDYIELDLLVFPSLPRPASNKALETARRIIEENRLCDQNHASSTDVQWKVDRIKETASHLNKNDSLVERSLSMWLGHAIDCGLDWTTKFPDLMVLETGQGKWIDGTLGEHADPMLAKAAQSLLAQLLPDGAADDSRKRQDHIHKLTRFLTCILDPRFLLVASTSPRCQPCGPDDFMITPSISNRSWIAVPACTAHLPMWEHRAWIVEPFDPAADTLEDPKSHLPYLGVKTTAGGEKPQVINPILTSDWGDQRSKRNEKGTWKLRRRDCIIAPKPLSRTSDLGQIGGGVLLLKRQRVYGAEDYDWTAMRVVSVELMAQQETK